jgi:hypothetical protein
LDNRFRHGKAHFEFSGDVPLASAISGMRLESAVLDPEIGMETVLILTETTPFADKLKERQRFDLQLTPGAARTSLGPVMFLLWWMPPVTNDKPFALYEQILNPTHPGVLAGLRKAAKQTHLHLLFVGPGGKLLDVYEFENVFQFDRLVPICERACEDHAGMDFAAAKKEYGSSYDVMELFREGLSRM